MLKQIFLFFTLNVAICLGDDTWQVIQQSILNPKCIICHTEGTSFAEQSGLILTEEVAYEELINATPTNIHAAEDGLELVGTEGISSLYSSFLWEKINAPNSEHFYEDHPEYGSIMPLGLDFLTNGELEYMRQWIIAGAPMTGHVADQALLLDTTRYIPPNFAALEIPENGLQVHLPPFEVPPNFERELFYYVELDTLDFLYINRIKTTMRPGSHHFIVYTFDESGQNFLPPPGVYRDIRNFDGSTNDWVLFQMQLHKFISGTQTRIFEYSFPEGVALKIDPNFGFDLNSHYANYSNDTIIGEIYNNFYFSNPDEIEREAEILQLTHLDISLPPQQETTLNVLFWVSEEFGEAVNVFQLFTHAHKHNLNFKIFKVNQNDDEFRELIYVSYDWEHPPIMRFDPPLTFESDDGFEMEATFYNNTDEEINFGLLSTDEMMVLFGLYYTGDLLNIAKDKHINSEQFQVFQNYPNPFNPVTTLQYDLFHDVFVNITIYDLLGNVVRNIINETQKSGKKTIKWNATNNQGQLVSAGVYLYSIKAGNFRQTKKMILLK
ncbi:MAG: T9SS type A sorting domain-containing protein [Candidatus Neomarinimicrobiota bacterium]